MLRKEAVELVTSASPPPRDTTRRIRRIAIGLFAERGYHGTGIRDIAAGSDLSLSTVYHYVRNKEQLLVEITDQVMCALLEAADQVLAQTSDPTERLAGLVRAHVQVQGRIQLEALVADRELASLGQNERAKAIKVRDSYEERWGAVLDEGVAGGDFESRDTHLTRLGLLQMCNGVAFWFLPSGDRSLEDVAESFADLAIGMVQSETQHQERLLGGGVGNDR